ncbi:hypothetical protein ACFYUL_03990 [Streptomyces sp. NPDC004311]|uniref:hypothetical protein n=1 Tax=unclassified Streptomyces TaxID=2593676 RepID=UPI00367DAE65
MADERDRWLDRAAADELLRGGPAEPVGPAANAPARTEAARLRAALDALAAVAEPPPAGVELPGEEAAVAAFRTARGAAPAAAGARPRGRGAHEPLIDLGRPEPAPARRRGRTVSFGLAAALASVAAGGLAAAAGAGLLDGPRRTTAGPGPALSVSAEADRIEGVGSGAPTFTPKLRPTPLPDGSLPPVPPEPARPTAGTGRTTPEFGGIGGATAGTSVTGGGGAGKDSRDDQSTLGGQDGGRETPAAGGTAGKDRDRELDGRLKTDLCEDYRRNRLDEARRERLSRLADGLTRIPAYCASVLGDTDGPKHRDSPLGGTLRSSTLEPAVPMGSESLRSGR